MRVLLVEPDNVLGGALCSALEQAGHEVLRKRSAQASLDALENAVPDVIVLEIQLGLHNGIEFLYEIRSYPEWQKIPVIVHTLNNKTLDSQYKEAFTSLGVAKVFYKPRTTTQQLLRSVSNLVHAL